MPEEVFREVASDDLPGIKRDTTAQSSVLTDWRARPLKKGTNYRVRMGYVEGDSHFMGENIQWKINYQFNWDYVIKGIGGGSFAYGVRLFSYNSQSDTSQIRAGDALRVRCDMQYWQKGGGHVKRDGRWSEGQKFIIEDGDPRWHGVISLKVASTGEYVEHRLNTACTIGHKHRARFQIMEF
ncbi:hypothetical protein [Streptomyces sp. NPDC058622]|uniref:hypothetical protein n=1 Tax=Streptomyces sp. NPDC058622 TaxID=3346562 RepID=UPI003659A765